MKRFINFVGGLTFILLLQGCQKQMNGRYVSHVKLPTGMEMLEVVDFRPDGTCRYGHPPDFMAECSWTRRGDLITIERAGKTLAKLTFKDEQLMLVEGDHSHTPFVRETLKEKAESAHANSASPH